MRKRGKVDDNHAEIVAALRAAGCSVISLANVGGGTPDILCGCRDYGGRLANYLLEIKDGSKSPSRRALTPDQREFFATWRGQCVVVHSVDEALEAVRR